MINTLFLTTVAVEPTFGYFFFSTRKHVSVACCAILSIFFEEQCTQNHPQSLSGLSRPLFSAPFLEVAVYDQEERFSLWKMC